MMDIQRLRNLTTRRLHTNISHVYQDLESISGQRGIMTHNLPGFLKAVEPWLKEKVADPRCWDGQYDPAHIGEIDLPEPTKDEQRAIFARWNAGE